MKQTQGTKRSWQSDKTNLLPIWKRRVM